MVKSEQAYLKNSLLFECLPFVHFLFDEFKGHKCDYCMTTNKSLKKCSNCLRMYYCDKTCQKKDWKCHKLECNHYKNNYEILCKSKIQRLLFRLYLITDSEPQIMSKTFESYNGHKRCLNDLMAHSQEIQEDYERQTDIQSIRDDFRSIAIDIPIEELTKLYGILVINCISIVIKEHFKGYQHCGSGLYLLASALDHCCSPNVYAIAEQNRIQLKAAKGIAQNEELFISYITTDRPTVQRRQELRERYYFDCHCFRCKLSDNYLIKSTDNNFNNVFINNFNERLKKMNANNEINLQISYNPSLTLALIEDLKRCLSKDNKEVLVKHLEDYIKYVRNHIIVSHGQHYYLYDLFVSIVESKGFNV